MGLLPLEEEEETRAFSTPREDTVMRWLSTSQEESPHQDPHHAASTLI